MRIGLLSDVHGNLPALEAVLEACSIRCDALWCLGDTVGYGASPNECVALVRDRCELVLAGNHDLAATGRVDFATFSSDAGRAIRWTREVLAADAETWLGTLEPSAQRGPIGLFHALAARPGVGVRRRCRRRARRAVEHDARAGAGRPHARAARDAPGRRPADRRPGRRRRRRTTSAAAATRSSTPARSASRATATRAPRGCCSTSTTTAGRSGPIFQRVRYDIAAAQRAIEGAGLPQHLADRLSFGM